MRLALLALAAAAVKAASSIDFTFSAKDATFQVGVSGATWFLGQGLMVRDAGQSFSTQDGSLKFQSSASATGLDGWGSYTATEATFMTGTGKKVVAAARFYQAEGIVAFEQRFPDGLENTQTGDRDSVITAFPIYRADESNTAPTIGYLSWQGDMSGSSPHMGMWDNSTSGVGSGIVGTGPVAFYSEDVSDSVLIAPASNFMAASHSLDNGNVMCGVMGNVTSIPAGYSIEFSLMNSPTGGINRVTRMWGERLQRRYQKPYDAPSYDPMTRFLQYSTDNGAVYYYNTQTLSNGTVLNYEDTLHNVKAYADEQKIPYRSILLDSYWYPKGPHDGVTEWLPEASMFPHGFGDLSNRTGWLFLAHNRYWSSENVYATQNGGDYEFLIEGEYALPLTERFWDFLMMSSRNWGLTAYEQDWLDNEFDNVPSLTQNVTLARTWLMQFGNAAGRANLHVQYCMSHVRHMLQSVEIPSVTTARASGDYHSDLTEQWQIGVSSLLASSLGVAPSKDNAWSVADQPQCAKHYNDGRREPFRRLQAAVLSLSRGPVAFSDGVGASDASLIMRACMADGTLLRPSRSVTAMDSQFVQASFGAGGANGQLWSTETRVAGRRFVHVLGAQMMSSFALKFEEMELDPTFKYIAIEANGTQNGVFSVSPTSPLHIPKSDKLNFTLHHIYPQEPNGWTLLGELDKWVPTSPDRFTHIVSNTQDLEAHVRGPEGETVNVSFLPPASSEAPQPQATTPVTVSCTIAQSGTIKFTVPAKSCTPT